jgi:putative oxidoreductase
MMKKLIQLAYQGQQLLNKTRSTDFLAPLLLRAYLAPIFWFTANNKWNPFNPDSSLAATIEWFGNDEWGLGLPLPALLAVLAWAAEYFGAILLLFGLSTRWICIPLMITMIVAAFSVHWQNGWQFIHDMQSPWAAPYAGEALMRLQEARAILREHGDYERITEFGNLVMSNNGIEWAATYFIMLLVLFFTGGGRYISADYWLSRFSYKPS